MNVDERAGKKLAPADRQRGRGFPIVSLPDAIRIVSDAAKYGISHQLSAFAGYMGHKTTNSGPFKQRLAALRDWGLISKEGDIIKLTELGRRLALPPDPTKIQADLLVAFSHVKEFKQVYDGSAMGTPLDLDTLGNNAVHSLGVSVKAKGAFVESFAKSAVAAGLASRPADGQIILLPEPTSERADEADAGDQTPGDDSPLLVRQEPKANIVFRQSWPVRGGEVRLEVGLDHPLPASAFQRLGSVVAEAEGLVEQLGAEDGPPE